MSTEQVETIIGAFFLSRCLRGDSPPCPSVQWQGQVLGQPNPGIYLVQLYEWLTGGASDQQLVRVEDMVGWSFYRHPEDWRYAADHRPDHTCIKAS